MLSKQSDRTTRLIVVVNLLLLSSTFALPAKAEIEEVVVTAQKRTEDAQSVPIAITAFSGQDLNAQKITQFKDLPFHAPNVTYTSGNFEMSDFQIRGIGVTAVGYDNESGVAINFDEVYLATPELYEASFYDLSGVEILAGPQSTLYGRGASAGVVNVNIAKPQMDAFSASLIVDAGNYDAWRIQGVVNVPIIDDELALRIAGDWDKRDGFVKNLFDNQRVDGLDQYSFRPTLRWQPTNQTTIDVTGEFTSEDDTHMRADKALCMSDPSGVLGCLPNGNSDAQAANPYATLPYILSSQQAFKSAFASTPVAALAPLFGLFNLQAPLALVPLQGGMRDINTDFTPIWHSQDNFLSGKWAQTLTPWLASVLVLGYDRDTYSSQQGYETYPGLRIPTNSTPGVISSPPYPAALAGLPNACLASLAGAPNLNCAEAAFLRALTAIGGAAYAAHYAPYFAVPGELPKSNIGGMGLTGGNFTVSPNIDSRDQSDGSSSEFSTEWRLNTSFSGPVNGMLGVYYLHTNVTGDYYVTATTLDYPGIILGGLDGLLKPALCGATGCIYSPPYYHNLGTQSALTSKSAFGEVYYTVIPDTFKLTGGVRFTEDNKFSTGRTLVVSGGLAPIGTASEDYFPTSPAPPANPDGNIPVKQTFDAWTGRLVADWTPKLDFTDQTLIYASYADGYKAGGANPGVTSGLPTPQTYNPENIVAYELGTKNLLLDGMLQANGDVYYYNYSGLQVAEVINNTSVNQNIAADVWGVEGSFVWQATDRLQFGLNFAHEESSIQNTALIDTANPTGGNQHTLLIKDDTISSSGSAGQNCVLYFNGVFPGLPAGYVAPAGGVHALAAYGIPNVAFGSCNPAMLAAAAASTGYNPPSMSGPQSYAGQFVSLDGHGLQNQPDLSLNVSVQYTQPLSGAYSLTGRLDAHWQSHMWGTIFEDPAAFVGAEYVLNASLQLNPPDDFWYVQAFVKNITNQTNITGLYVGSQSAGLSTNAFLGDPRTFGIELGAKLN
ncbi:MAG TPA: TonB-dependent receptor plug domain-containing protein [Rhizomicrobium sp.]|nr:TonB-dependent receptor plug domain-containing protein [Rhizomicrobium sp.]